MRRPRLPRRDPLTGDELTSGEALSWVAQGIIRRWAFIGMFTVVTAICWTLGGAVIGWWNWGASYLALVVESVVGIGVFQMSRRDAVILRATFAGTKRIEEAATRIEHVAELIYEQQLRGER